MRRYRLLATEAVELERREPLLDMYVLSPYVWLADGRWEIALRAVNRAPVAAEKVARIYHGTSGDGLRFVMDEEPAIAPGPPGSDDHDGCEDPTVVKDEGRYHVFYTGWNQERLEGQLLRAVGDDIRRLRKGGRVPILPAAPPSAKEVTPVRLLDRTCWLFFEYAAAGASRIGAARASSLEGPWELEPDPFEARPGSWDGWHLSPGPIAYAEGERPLLFYNGGSRDARWRIGWVELSPDFRGVVRRSDEPLIGPGEVRGEDTDIAFAASAVERGDEILLYYSVSDKDLRRATIAVA